MFRGLRLFLRRGAEPGRDRTVEGAAARRVMQFIAPALTEAAKRNASRSGACSGSRDQTACPDITSANQ